MMAPKGKTRFLMAKVGMDTHDRGARVIMMALRDAGIEVIYTGMFQTPEAVVKTAMDEGVDIIGLSFLNGEHKYYTQKVMELLKEQGENIPVLVGGVIPKRDISVLKEMGAKEVFRADSSMQSIIRCVGENVKAAA